MTAPDELPRTILLDLNGTLIPSSPGAPQDTAGLRKVGQLAQELGAAGSVVGLCSDSPLEQLWEFGQDIGLGEPREFPVVAENGNVADIDGRVRVMTPFAARKQVRSTVAALASEHGLQQADETLAPEFGGVRPGRDQWAFGANRRASVSVFGPRDFLVTVGQRLRDWAGGNHTEISTESSPDGRYLGIHPYRRVDLGKQRTLATLASGQKELLMIGNSLADWVPACYGVRCAFVADSNIPDDVRAEAWRISEQPDVHGVIDILTRLTGLTAGRAGRS
ncbi:hypothetical protein ACIOEX_05675 [Streptomyces sp. NPDC087850]|uniref:hypothetical protein n=1 Tax=Streptomyces sp. NPDC087850 TaxID=3365809 RepID=UPI003805C451